MKIQVNVKVAVALLALASCAGALRAQQTLTVNKFACDGSSYIANAANLPNPGGISAQCSKTQTAVLNVPVVYFVSIVSTNSTSVLTTLVDTLPTYFRVLNIVCNPRGGANAGDCGSTYLTGRTLNFNGIMIPSTSGASVVIEVQGYFTASGGDQNDFNNCATGTPSAPPAVGQPNTNINCHLVTVPATPAPWDLGVGKTFIQGTGANSNTFTTTLTLTNNSAQTIYLTNFLQLYDELNVSSSPIPAIQFTLNGFACSAPGTSTCPTNLPSGTVPGVINTSSTQTFIQQFLWQEVYPNQGYIGAGDTITITFKMTFTPICGGGSLIFNNEAFLALYNFGTAFDNTSTNNVVYVPSTSSTTVGGPSPGIPLTYTYPPGPGCPSITKTATPASSVAWSSGVVTYTITVTNPTSSIATINVVDNISKAAITPPFTITVTSGPTCTATGGSSCGTSVLSTLAPFTNSNPQTIFTVPVTLLANGSATVTFTATFTPLDNCQVATGNLTIINSAGMTATFASGGTVTSSADAPIVMAPLANCPLSVTKSTAATEVTFGTPITYTVTYTNSSPSQSTTISTLTDMLSEGPSQLYGPFSATINSVSCNGTTPTGNMLTLFGGTLTAATSVAAAFQGAGWRGNPIINLNSGSQMTFPPNGVLTCAITITPQQPPPGGSCTSDQNMVNAAYFDQGIIPLFGPQPLFYAQSSLPLPHCQQIVISKTVDNPTPSPGGQVTFTINVQNTGGSSVSGITLTDPLPAMFTIQSASCASCMSISPISPGITTTLMAALPTLAPSATVTIVLVVNVPTVGGSYQNVATIDFGPQTNVYNSGGNTSNTAQVQVQTPTLAKSFSPSTVVSGGQSLLTFTIANPLGNSVSGLQFTDTLPAGLVALTTPAPTTTCGGAVQIGSGGNSITFSNGSINGSVGTSPTCTITVTVQATPCGALLNQWSSPPANSNITNINNLDPTGASATLTVSGNCPPSGYVEVCKASCPTDPIPPNGIYDFTVPGSAFSTKPLMVPVGECSGPIPVTAGTPTIAELLTPGISVCNVTAVGYSPFAGLTNLLVPGTFNPTTGTAEVIIQAPATAGNTSLETIVTFYNYVAPPAELKLCKIAGNGITTGTPFNFTAVNITNAGKGYTSAPSVTFTGGGCTTEPMATASVSSGSVTGINLISPGSGCTTAPVVTIGIPPIALGNIPATATATIVSVEAGPPSEAGYCELVSGTFVVGTSGTVTETVPAGDAVPTVTVNGVTTTPSPCVFSPSGFPCSVTAAIGPGINEVSFTNTCVTGANGQPCPQTLPGGGTLPNLEVVHYSLVSQVAATGTQMYVTYRADLSNLGPIATGPLMASLTSLGSPRVQVVGPGALEFPSASAYSQVTSSNTFMILTDPSIPVDFSKLNWTFHPKRSVPPRR